jgi:hypothetical protein
MPGIISKIDSIIGEDGGFGIDYIDDTSTHSVDLNYENTDGTPAGYVYHQGFPYWRKIEATAAAVIGTLTSHADSIDPDWDTSDTLAVGQVIEGQFTVVDLTSGTVKLYR